jgi:hypothetical protein
MQTINIENYFSQFYNYFSFQCRWFNLNFLSGFIFCHYIIFINSYLYVYVYYSKGNPRHQVPYMCFF